MNKTSATSSSVRLFGGATTFIVETAGGATHIVEIPEFSCSFLDEGSEEVL